MCLDRPGAPPASSVSIPLFLPCLKERWGGGSRRKPGADDGSSYRVYYILKPLQHRMHAWVGDTFISGGKTKATEHRSEMISMWRQPLAPAVLQR